MSNFIKSSYCSVICVILLFPLLLTSCTTGEEISPVDMPAAGEQFIDLFEGP